MYLENVIRPTEVVEFAAQLQAHQVARLPSLKGLVVLDESDDEVEGEGMAVDGGEKKSERIGPETVLDRAVMEHNLLSCSKVRFFPFLTFTGFASYCCSCRLASLVQWDVLAYSPSNLPRRSKKTALRQHLVCRPRSAARPRTCRSRVPRPTDD